MYWQSCCYLCFARDFVVIWVNHGYVFIITLWELVYDGCGPREYICVMDISIPRESVIVWLIWCWQGWGSVYRIVDMCNELLLGDVYAGITSHVFGAAFWPSSKWKRWFDWSHDELSILYYDYSLPLGKRNVGTRVVSQVVRIRWLGYMACQGFYTRSELIAP